MGTKFSVKAKRIVNATMNNTRNILISGNSFYIWKTKNAKGLEKG